MCSTTQSFKKSTPRLLMAVSISGAVGNSLLRVQYITAPSSKSTRPHRSSGSAVVDLKTPGARRREHKAIRRPPAEYARTMPAKKSITKTKEGSWLVLRAPAREDDENAAAGKNFSAPRPLCGREWWWL